MLLYNDVLLCGLRTSHGLRVLRLGSCRGRLFGLGGCCSRLVLHPVPRWGGPHALSEAAKRRASRQVIDYPPPGEVDALSSLWALRDAVEVVLLELATHRAEVTITEG